jgi:SNF2 family DNA or RNA helicase
MTHQVPASINRYLHEYQRMGIQFMFSSVIEGKGCVLGDDMGLGKTVQVRLGVSKESFTIFMMHSS